MAREVTQRQRAEQFYNSLLKGTGVLGYETPRGRFKRLQLLLAHDQQTRQAALREGMELAAAEADMRVCDGPRFCHCSSKIYKARLDRLAREG